MIKNIFLAIIAVAILSCNKTDFAVMQFEETKHDFGKIKQNEIVSHDFKFINTGNKDLEIIDAKGSCGCTVPEFPTKPIKPNQTGVIKVTFNSQGKFGIQNKKVVISANTKTGNEIIEIITNIEN